MTIWQQISAATGKVVPLVPDISDSAADSSNITSLINSIFPTIIQVGVFLAILFIAYYGLRKVLSNVPGVKGDSANRIWDIVWGLAILLAAYLILNTLNPKIIEVINQGLQL